MKKSLVIFFSFILMSSFFISGIYAQDATDENFISSEGANVPVDVPENTLASSAGYVSPEGEVVSTSDETAIEEQKVAELVQEAETFDEELSVDAGITPDSGLYFVEDKILAPFRDDSVNRERKIAEMRELAPRCGQGEQSACDNMRKSFERYQGYANNFERDVSPEERERALESSKAIRGTFVRDIAQNLPPTEKDEFVREIVKGEDNIAIAAEIAGKIEDLCRQLAKLDPNEYSRVCSSGEDAPDWRKKLDDDLTEEQRQEALKFGEIMSQCFETAGQNCECEKISFPDFAEACSIAAPLATACEIENNEEACKQLDDLEMPELPPYLENILDQIEGSVNEGKYGMFLPPECEEAGATTPKECAKIMIQTHAPEECKPALLAADVQSEREARDICDKIMFEANAPIECVEAGIRDPRECGKLMWTQNAPQECTDAGITGEGRDDPKKCEQIMRSQFGPQGEFGPSCAPGTDCSGPGGYARGTGPNRQMSGGNCAGISNPEERLKCFDNAGNFVQEYHEDFRGKFEETQNQQRKCAEDCGRKNSAWDFSGGNCVCKAPNFQEFQQQHQDNFRQDFNNQQFNNQQYGDFKDGQFYPPQGFQQGQFQPPQGMIPPGDYQQYNQPNQQQPSYPQPPEGYQYPQPPQDYQQYNQQPPTTSTEPTTSGTTTTTEPSTSTTSSEPAPTTSSEPAPSSEPSPVTGGVISNNKFLRFWFWG